MNTNREERTGKCERLRQILPPGACLSESDHHGSDLGHTAREAAWSASRSFRISHCRCRSSKRRDREHRPPLNHAELARLSFLCSRVLCPWSSVPSPYLASSYFGPQWTKDQGCALQRSLRRTRTRTLNPEHEPRSENREPRTTWFTPLQLDSPLPSSEHPRTDIAGNHSAGLPSTLLRPRKTRRYGINLIER